MEKCRKRAEECSMKEVDVSVNNFHKTYGDFVAVDDVSFEITHGEIFGLLGPNGAGKTSTLECLEGLRTPTRGELRVAGINPTHQFDQLRNLMGVQSSILPSAMGKIALLLPTTYAMNAFRGLAMDLKPDFDPFWSLIILLLGGLLAFGLAIHLFYWDDTDLAKRRKAPLALLALLPYMVGAIFLSFN